ncbi:MAG TPA: ATP-binding protein [bacterium]|nr:ATP-binding protein [bacterium]
MVGIVAVNLAILVSINIFGLELLSSVRALVGAESLWAKAQKNAVYGLSKYAFSHREADYQTYLSYLSIPEADHLARMELSRPKPDLRVTDAAFVLAQNDPDDVRGMSLLLVYLNRYPPIHRAIDVWGEGDTELLRLRDMASDYHALTLDGKDSPAANAAFILGLGQVNASLTMLENEFSRLMGQVARWAKSAIIQSMVLLSLMVGFVTLAITLWVSRNIARGVLEIGDAASKAARGDLAVRVEVRSADELGNLAEAFNVMVSGLARIERMKNDFLSNVTHELRTPLTLNLSPLESLLGGEYGEVPERQKAVLGIMRNNMLRLLQLINGILDLAKLDAGRMPTNLEPTDLSALCAAVAEDFRPALASKGLRWEADIGPCDPPILTDRYLYERILFNLLSNAVKFTPSGGRLSLRLRVADSQALLEVRDSGIGISDQDRAKLFQKFSQAEASSTRRFEGTGLGLALVKECATALGGTVELQSRVGEGSVFTVRCPAPPAASGQAPSPRRAIPWNAPAAAPAAAPPLAAAAADDRAPLPKVLIAEDNVELTAYIDGLLAPIARVRAVGDGREALREARDWRPDLVLSDVMMPGMDGIALTRALKTDPATAAMPVVLLTALTEQSALLRGWEAGADDYLFKPFHPRELQARIRTLLSMVAWRGRCEAQRQRREMLEQFTRIASHDLKAPLRRMASYAGLLLHSSKDILGEESLGHLQVIERSAGQLHSMIVALVEYAHLDSPDEAFGVCELGPILAAAIRFLAVPIAEAQANIDVGPLPAVKAVPEHIFSLFQNLISNSLKYRSPGRPAKISVRAVRRDHEWMFRLEDNGKGFDPKHREAVFTLFTRLEGGAMQGDGMGLAISKRIVEAHGGSIWAESRPGEGTAICWTLPALEAAA